MSSVLLRKKNWIRLFFVLTILVLVLLLGNAALAYSGVESDESGALVDARTPVDEITVIAGHGDAETSGLFAVDVDGEVVYSNQTYDRYFDIDPVNERKFTVEYVAAKHIYGAPCAPTASCTHNVIERLNLSTGKIDRVYDRYTPGIHNSRWHDADRISETEYLVADIDRSSVFIVNTSTEVIEWQWEAQSAYSITSGDSYPPGEPHVQSDWTHINDVEYLPGGRIMVSVRNQNEVVFIDPRTGIQSEWTLGEEENQQILNRQHNPDFIPVDDGGPAVIVGDSHNNRAVEYQRENGAWTRTWRIDTPIESWIRDADRLPNGHTLISGVERNQVVEVDEVGEVIWRVSIDTPYEAERLGTGDESKNGPSAKEANLTSGIITKEESSSSDQGGVISYIRTGWIEIRNILPTKLVSAVIYVLPPWVRFIELTAILGVLSTIAIWSYLEYRWSRYAFVVQKPFKLKKD